MNLFREINAPRHHGRRRDARPRADPPRRAPRHHARSRPDRRGRLMQGAALRVRRSDRQPLARPHVRHVVHGDHCRRAVRARRVSRPDDRTCNASATNGAGRRRCRSTWTTMRLADEHRPRSRRFSRPGPLVEGSTLRVEGRGARAVQADLRRPGRCGRGRRATTPFQPLRVRLQTRPSSQQAVEELAERLRLTEGVADVARTIGSGSDRLVTAVNVLSGPGPCSRRVPHAGRRADRGQRGAPGPLCERDEIEIMQLVGAPDVTSGAFCHGGRSSGRNWSWTGAGGTCRNLPADTISLSDPPLAAAS